MDKNEDVLETCMHLIDELLIISPELISDPQFYEHVYDNINLIFHDGKDNNGEDDDDIDEIIEYAIELFHCHFIPPRSYSYTYIIDKTPEQITSILNQLEKLKNSPQPTQRTSEWYQFRHNLITASNAYKAFESQSTQNQLIYEKCLPIAIGDNTKPVNVDTATHWGQKFEPVSVMYYEYIYQTKVSDFGCIQHSSCSFLGASPDGIMSDPNLPRFGRMLEIKNIVNRDIDGIPKKEYWIQMQLQMETCDLDECDFLETRFVEYEFSKDYYEDMDGIELGNMKGIIMYFSTDDGKPVYIYKPLICHNDSLWETDTMEKYSHLTWIRNIYWKLAEVSCVLVMRNRRWFRDNLETLTNIWTTILKERVEGYSHRAPNKRVKVEADQNTVGGYLG